MKTKIFIIGGVFFSFFICFNSANAAPLTSFTVAPATANDNLVGQTNTTWRFTIHTNTRLSTSTAQAVEITFPTTPNGQHFSTTGTPTASTTWNPAVDWLDFATSSVATVSGLGTKIVIMASSTQPSTTTPFVIDIQGLDNPNGPPDTTFKSYDWYVGTCQLATPENLHNGCATYIDATTTASATLRRRGGYIDSWSYVPNHYEKSATSTFTITFTASTTLAVGEKIWVNFPTDFNITNATTSNQTISGSAKINSTTVTINNGNGLHAVIATTSDATIAAGATVSFTIGNIGNPSAMGSYPTGGSSGLNIFTTTVNGGLVDGANNGGEQLKNGNRPMPPSSILIGGTNTISGQVYKRNATTGGLDPLTLDETKEISVHMGCPDKMFDVGTKRLDANGKFSYDHLLDATYMMGVMPDNTSDSTFFATHLQPSEMMVNVTGSETASSSAVFEIPDGVVRGSIIGGAASASGVYVRAYTNTLQSFSPVFPNADFSGNPTTFGGVGYFQIPVKSGQTWNFSVETDTAITSGTTQYWTPSPSSVYIEPGKAVTSLSSLSFVVADKTLNVTLKDADNNLIDTTNPNAPHPCISIKRTGSNIMGPGGQGKCTTTSVGGVNVYQMQVPAGAFSIQVMMPDVGFKEYPITVLSTDNTVIKTIIIARPTTYIAGTIIDPDGFGMTGVSVAAQGNNGGFNQTMSSGAGGSYKLYVRPGTYSMYAFAPGYGTLGSLTGVVVAEGSYATENFSISAGKTIKGKVCTDTDGDSGTTCDSDDTALEGVQIHAYGTSGENGSQSRNDGTYTIVVPTGSYAVEAWSPTYGFLGVISTVDVSAGNKAGQDIVAAAQGTLQITVTAANTYGLTEIFAGAYSTSTDKGGKGNGSNTWTATSTSGADADLVTSFSLPKGYYKIDVGTPGYGNLTSLAANSDASSTAITAGQTKKLTILLPTMKTLSGVTTANATVWASRTDGPGKYNTTANSSTGAYSMYLPTGNTYMVGASLPGYVNMPTTITNFSADTTQNLTLTLSAYNISGTISSSVGGVVGEGFIWATKAGNTGWVGSEISANGSYSLAVDSGTWTVYANAPCHNSSSGTSQTGSGTVNITLIRQNNCSYQPPQMQSIVPTTGGVVATSSISVNIPANALGTGSSNVSFSVSKPGTNPPATLNAAPIGNSVRTISASDGNGTAISTLSNSIEITITYDPTDVTDAGSSESNLQLAYWNTTTNTWDPIASTLDMTNHTLTGQVNHLTDFAPIIPTSEGAPDTPDNLAAAKSGDTHVSLSWTIVDDATSYLLYRDTTDSASPPYLATINAPTLTHTDSVSAGTTYYYRVTASNASGESAASDSVHVTSCSSVSNGTVSGTGCTLVCNSSYYELNGFCSHVASGGGSPSLGGGGSGGSPLTPAVTTPASVVTAVTTVPSVTPAAPSVAQPSAVALAVSPVFNKDLELGFKGDDVKRLQELLKQDKEIYPDGLVTGYFGSLTKAAVIKFQAKYGLPKVGRVGPATRVKIKIVFEKVTETVSLPSGVSAGTAVSAPVAAPASETQAQIKSLQEQIQALQVLLLQAQIKLLQENIGAASAR